MADRLATTLLATALVALVPLVLISLYIVWPELVSLLSAVLLWAGAMAFITADWMDR
jgi:hypothetical protein